MKKKQNHNPSNINHPMWKIYWKRDKSDNQIGENSRISGITMLAAESKEAAEEQWLYAYRFNVYKERNTVITKIEAA